jgi:hypothetical protein
MAALKNPLVTFGTCFVDDFQGATDSLFVDFFWVNRGCEHFRIHASPLESISLMNSESAVAQFSLTVSKSTGAGRAEESTCHLWNLIGWWFHSRHRLSFRWLFLSQQGLRPLPNPRVTFGRFLGDDFWGDSEPVFVDYLWVTGGC